MNTSKINLRLVLMIVCLVLAIVAWRIAASNIAQSNNVAKELEKKYERPANPNLVESPLPSENPAAVPRKKVFVK